MPTCGATPDSTAARATAVETVQSSRGSSGLPRNRLRRGDAFLAVTGDDTPAVAQHDLAARNAERQEHARAGDGLFRGALDVRAAQINDAMKLAAARALADLARRPVSESVLRAYGLERLPRRGRRRAALRPARPAPAACRRLGCLCRSVAPDESDVAWVAGFRTPNRGEGMQGRKVCLYLQGSNFRVP